MGWARAILIGSLCLVCVVCDEPDATSDIVLWESTPIEPLDTSLFGDAEWLGDVSTWIGEGCGEEQPFEPGQMGDFAVGNGRVFSLSGYNCPLNSLHTMIGPNYQKREVFFEDTYSRLELDGERLSIIEGHMFRVSGAPILISRERTAEVDLYTLTFAPLTGGAEDPVERAIIREIIIVNRTSSTLADLRLTTHAVRNDAETRRRTLVALEPAGVESPRVISLALEPSAQARFLFAYVLSIGGEGEEETIAALEDADLTELLESTRDAWRGFLDDAASLESPDARVNDLFHGLLITVRSQQDRLGGVSPMSEYTRIWTRDLAGPVRFYLRAGLFEHAYATLDYYHTAAAEAGDIRNSFNLDVDPDPPPEEPDWASLEPFDGRESAEAPSYLPLMARWYALATGDHRLVEDWFPFFRRALDGQAVSEENLLSFSADETFRTAMAITHGLDLAYAFEESCWSANSSFLFVASSEALAAEAEAIGLETEAAELRERAERVRLAAEETFWHADGYYVPYIDWTAPESSPPLYEDVSTKPIWTGYLPADDERALTNLESVVERIAHDNGMLVSPLHPMHDNAFGSGIHEGVYTGMNPGYGLANLALTDHPLAEAAFNSVQDVVSYSGNIGEYQIYDDHSSLQIIYDPSGILGDYTARYRPWEGGILGDALMLYLTGLEPDATEGSVRLAPHLPNGWPTMTWRRLRVGEVRFDLRVEDEDGRRTIAVEPTTSGSLTVHLEVPLPPCDVSEIMIDGESIDMESIDLWSPFGQTRIRLPSEEVSRESPLTVEVLFSVHGDLEER